MPSDAFITELSQMSIAEWQRYCLLKFGCERVEGGAKTALELATDAFMSVITIDSGDKAPKLLHINDFLASVGEPPPALAGEILPANKLIILGGAPKEGKSLVALEILHCIAAGLPVMQRFDTGEPAPVAYFGMEDGAQEIKERLEMRGARDIPLYVCSQSFNMHTIEGNAYFKQMIAGMPSPPVCVVIDTVRKAFPTVKDWNDAAQVGPVISPFCDWAHDNCTVIMVHHTNKNPLAVGVNKLSGSNALTSSADGFMILEDKQRAESGNLRWKFEADGRAGMGGKFKLEMDTHTLKVHVVSESDEEQERKEAQDKRNSEVRSEILAYCRSAKSFTIPEIAPIIDCPKDVTGRRVRELESEFKIKKNGDKRSTGNGRPSDVYALTEGDSKEGDSFYSDSVGARSEIKTNGAPNTTPSNDVTAFFASDAEEV